MSRRVTVPAVFCSCAHNSDGSVTTMLCSRHADKDPCATMAAVTGRRRRGSIVRGVCSACGWMFRRDDHGPGCDGPSNCVCGAVAG